MKIDHWIRSFNVRRLVVAASIALGGSLAVPATQAAEPVGAVYLLSNELSGNAVLVYARASDGSLAFSASYPTGGTGAIIAGNPPPDPLASQGSLTLGSGMLFAVNAGSNEISMFQVQGEKLALLDKQPSGGVHPVSVAVHGPYVYVLNSGDTPNISGFVIDSGAGRLKPLPGSQRALAGGTGSAAAQVSFNSDGNILLVSEKGTNLIDVYRVDHRGYASDSKPFKSNGAVPFGFSITNRGYAIFSEAGPSAASSYDIDDDGGISLISGSVPLTGQIATCWLITTQDGRYAFTANAGTGTISSLKVAPDGKLSLINAAASANLLAKPVLDMAITGNSKFLYIRDDGNNTVTGFRVGADGSLTTVGSATFPASLLATVQGIAAR